MDTISSACALALGNLIRYGGTELPVIDFGSRSASLDPLYPEVPRVERPSARRVIEKAFHWCSSRFPLRAAPNDREITRPLVRHIDARRTRDDDYLSASSQDMPGHVLLGASWPTASTYRLGSLIAHEAIHQGLFLREASGSPVRQGSLAYSPWRRTSRKGRLVWHAFWTFGCQFLLLAEAVTDGEEVLSVDSGLLEFMANMPPRVESCYHSMRQFDVVASGELERCGDALRLVMTAAESLTALPRFATALGDEQDMTHRDYQAWAELVLTGQTDKAGSR